METETEQSRPLTYYKKADATMNRIIIPKFFIDEHGRDFYMEVYKDKIIITPLKKEGE